MGAARPLSLAPVERFGSGFSDIAEVCLSFLERLEMPLEVFMVTSELKLCLVLGSIGLGGFLVLLLDEEENFSFFRR